MPSPPVVLRELGAEDLEVLYEQQRDPDATAMAAFPPRDREAFMAHWRRVLADPGTVKQAVLHGGELAGHIVQFEQDGEARVGFWIGREFWGKGIASRALALLLERVETRPLHARAAAHNVASIRVLEKCGFEVCGRETIRPSERSEEIQEVLLVLAPGR